MSKRKSTKYPGVQARESDTRKFRGRPDICYTIDYKDVSGKRIRKDVGWASQGFTAALASEMRSRLLFKEKFGIADTPSQVKSSISFKEAWEKYRQDWLVAQKKNTSSPDSIVNQYLQDFLKLKLDEITSYRLDCLMNNMRTAGLSAQTIRHAVGLVRRIMRRMAKWKLYTGTLPFDEITLPKLNNQRERFLTPDEAHKLLQEIGKRSIRTWLMALVSLHCGMRFGEIASMRWEHVDFQEMSIFIPESKSGKARHAVMTSEVANALKAMPSKSGLVFPDRNGSKSVSISKAFFRAVEACGLNNISGSDGIITDRRQRVVFHTLRHTYASWLAKGGQGQLAIADRLGHHSLEMTKRYTHIMDETRKASADVISKMFHKANPENQQF